ncbi:hypothetical protein DXG01_004335 [Tephrocybe rancida]|nr:hypothetical protein DXG01_004335 [Tephrocybe rancida]
MGYGDGTITHDELGTIMRKLGQTPTDEELCDMIREVDVDHNEKIDFDEFMALMASKVSGIDEDEEIEAAFKVFDRDNNGTISTAELKLVMQSLNMNLTNSELEQMMREADLNGDGVISLPDLQRNRQPGGGLQTSNPMDPYHAHGPFIPTREMEKNLEQPLVCASPPSDGQPLIAFPTFQSKDELRVRTAELNK